MKANILKIVFPLPSTDFDPTETAVPWVLLTEAGHKEGQLFNDFDKEKRKPL